MNWTSHPNGSKKSVLRVFDLGQLWFFIVLVSETEQHLSRNSLEMEKTHRIRFFKVEVSTYHKICHVRVYIAYGFLLYPP